MDQIDARTALDTFLGSGVAHPTLGLLYGRRRIGKSTLVEALARERGGFYWEATRGEAGVHLARLGETLGAHLGVGRLAFTDWADALAQLLRLGGGGSVPVVLDELGCLVEADPTLPSVIAAALGPAARRGQAGRARLVLCGSAMAVMQSLTAGEAPLRGRAGCEVVMQPFGFRAMAAQIGVTSRPLAATLYAVIGGVIGYATDMVDRDLPKSLGDVDRWVAARVLSPAATLHHEATTLLAEDPTLAAASPALHHSLLGVIANGAVTAGTIANRLRRSVPGFDAALKRLIAAGFVVRHEDPLRERRPVYALADPFLQFHYAVIEPHGAVLRARPVHEVWRDRLAATFHARVRGPVFEEQARSWVRQHASPETTGGHFDQVGPSVLTIDGVAHELDMVTTAGGDTPAQRDVLAIGEAKSGETMDLHVLRHLERCRAAIGTHAAHAKLLLFAPAFARDLTNEARRRSDIELIDLERLYGGM